MVKPDDISINGERSIRALSSDRLIEQLVSQRQRVFGITFWFVVAAEVAMWYFDWPMWVLIVVPIMWIGFLIHDNALLLLHELWEVNDQLAGRKDELKNLLERKGDNKN